MNQDKAAKQCVGLLAQAIGTNLAKGEDRKSGRERVEGKLRRVNSEIIGMTFDEAWEWSEDDDLVRAALSGLKADHVKSTHYDRKTGTSSTNYDLELLAGTWRIALRYFEKMAYGEGPMALATGRDIDKAMRELRKVFRQPNYISSR